MCVRASSYAPFQPMLDINGNGVTTSRCSRLQFGNGARLYQVLSGFIDAVIATMHGAVPIIVPVCEDKLNLIQIEVSHKKSWLSCIWLHLDSGDLGPGCTTFLFVCRQQCTKSRYKSSQDQVTRDSIAYCLSQR
jgi:hypothetical protein